MENSQVGDTSALPQAAEAGTTGTGLSLFWRTFALLSVLLLAGALVWTQTQIKLETESRAIAVARHVAALVNLSRAAVMHSDFTTRGSLINTIKELESVIIVPHKPKDVAVPMSGDARAHYIATELVRLLGPGTTVAQSVNGVPGLWVGFTIDNNTFWLVSNEDRFDAPPVNPWSVWLLVALALSLAGIAWVAWLINQPLKNLHVAASRLRDGDFAASALDESVATSEIRAVNVGFNRMTQKLARIEQDRAVMLAGISHDLRTPLARLRLEAELSVVDARARGNMVSDIAQLDAMINKFLDYARPGMVAMVPVTLGTTVDNCLLSQRKRPNIEFKVTVDSQLLVMADEVELMRVINNLLENAGRYGKSIDSGMATIEISAKALGKWVFLSVRDHGSGVAPEQLKQLATPFYRGEAARTAANGTGLGLSIVEKTVSRMGGALELSNASDGGLCATVRLQQAVVPPALAAMGGNNQGTATKF